MDIPFDPSTFLTTDLDDIEISNRQTNNGLFDETFFNEFDEISTNSSNWLDYPTLIPGSPIMPWNRDIIQSLMRMMYANGFHSCDESVLFPNNTDGHDVFRLKIWIEPNGGVTKNTGSDTSQNVSS